VRADGAAGRCWSRSSSNKGPEERAIRLKGDAKLMFSQAGTDRDAVGPEVDLDRILALPESAGRHPFRHQELGRRIVQAQHLPCRCGWDQPSNGDAAGAMLGRVAAT